MASLNDKITDVRNAARPNSARVATARSAAATNLACNDLTGWPIASKVHFVTYQIDSNSNPIPATQLDCQGIRSGNTLTNVTVIDGSDGGNSVGDVVEMLPTAGWAQDLADALTVSLERTGALKDDIITTAKIATGAVTTDEIGAAAITAAKLATDSVTTAKILNSNVTTAKLADANVTKTKLERPHYNCLFHSTDGGQVFGATQVRATYGSSDTINGYGITATTGSSASMTLTRDGLYQIHLRFRCVDVAASQFITFIYMNHPTLGQIGQRRQDQVIGVNQADEWNFTMYLPSGTVIWQDVFNGGGATRFGTANTGATSDEFIRRFSTSFTITEIR